MTTMFVKHHVSHFDTWREVYDAFEPVRKAHGVDKQKVYRSVDDRTTSPCCTGFQRRRQPSSLPRANN